MFRVVVGVLALAFFSTPASAQRRIDARKQADHLMKKLATAKGPTADRLQNELATLATDLLYQDEVEPVLVSALRARRVNQRQIAARMLRYSVSGSAVKPLMRAVQRDRSEDVRLEAVTSLCILKATAATGVLRKTATSDRKARVRAVSNAAVQVIEGKKSSCRSALQQGLAALSQR